MQQQTRAIHIVRAEPQKSQMIKRNHRFIFCKGSHTMVFGDLAWRPLVAISSSDPLRNFGERQGDAFAFREMGLPSFIGYTDQDAGESIHQGQEIYKGFINKVHDPKIVCKIMRFFLILCCINQNNVLPLYQMKGGTPSQNKNHKHQALDITVKSSI